MCNAFGQWPWYARYDALTWKTRTRQYLAGSFRHSLGHVFKNAGLTPLHVLCLQRRPCTAVQ